MRTVAPPDVSCTACDANVPDDQRFDGPDDRVYCPACGKLMQRMERMFVPEGAIIKDTRVRAAQSLREPVASPPRPAPAAPVETPAAVESPAASAAGRSRQSTMTVEAVSRTAKPPLKSTTSTRSEGGGGLMIVIILMLLGGGAWYMGWTPDLSSSPGSGGGSPEVPAGGGTSTGTNPGTVTPPPAAYGGKVEGVIPASDLAALSAAIGKEVTVEGRVSVAEADGSGRFFRIRLGSGDDAFESLIPGHRYSLFRRAFGNDVAGSLLGKTVQISGVVSLEANRPSISLNLPAQIALTGK